MHVGTDRVGLVKSTPNGQALLNNDFLEESHDWRGALVTRIPLVTLMKLDYG